jgi:hypothetical protein
MTVMAGNVRAGKPDGECTAFFDKVKRHLRYLIDDYGFLVAHQENLRIFDNCLVVLQSNDCRVRIVRDRGTVLIDVGPLSAPNVHRLSGSPDPWFDVYTAVAFLTQGTSVDSWEWFYASPDEHLEGEATNEWELAWLADKLQPYWREVFQLFREDVFEWKRKDLEEFRQKRMEESWRRAMQNKRRA